MSDQLARPYAQSIFEIGREDDTLMEWERQLESIARVVSDADFDKVLSLRLLSDQRLYELINSLLKDHLSEQAQNLLKLLIANKRLKVISSICTAFKRLCAQGQGIALVKVETARKLSDQQLDQLACNLESKLDKKVALTQTVNSDLIGGGMLRNGDQVAENSINASLRGLRSQLLDH